MDRYKQLCKLICDEVNIYNFINIIGNTEKGNIALVYNLRTNRLYVSLGGKMTKTSKKLKELVVEDILKEWQKIGGELLRGKRF